jgi:uncharacterized protein YgiM (DUF1202 family)
MTRVFVAFVALVLAACGGPKPPAPASSGPRSEPTPPAITAPATPPAAAPAPQATGPVSPVPPAASTAPAPVDAPAPTPQVLYVKTHLANFREGAGTSRKILRVLRQGVRLQVLETRTTWLRVRLDDGQEGWIAESVTSVTAPVTPAHTPLPRGGSPRVAKA